MSIRFTCPNCGSRGSISKKVRVTTRLRCLGCHTLFVSGSHEPLAPSPSKVYELEEELGPIPLDSDDAIFDVSNRKESPPIDSSSRQMTLPSGFKTRFYVGP